MAFPSEWSLHYCLFLNTGVWGILPKHRYQCTTGLFPQHILNLHFVVVVVAVPCPETPSSDVTPEGKYVVGPPYTLTPGSHPGFPSYLCNDSHPFLSVSLTQAYAVFNIYSSCLNSAFLNGIQTTERQRFVVVSSIIS